MSLLNTVKTQAYDLKFNHNMQFFIRMGLWQWGEHYTQSTCSYQFVLSDMDSIDLHAPAVRQHVSVGEISNHGTAVLLGLMNNVYKFNQLNK